VESDIAIAIQLSSACAVGVAANATPIAVAATASIFIGIPTPFLSPHAAAQATLLHGTTSRDGNNSRPISAAVVCWRGAICRGAKSCIEDFHPMLI
jgi:hypothetical protein